MRLFLAMIHKRVFSIWYVREWRLLVRWLSDTRCRSRQYTMCSLTNLKWTRISLALYVSFCVLCLHVWHAIFLISLFSCFFCLQHQISDPNNNYVVCVCNELFCLEYPYLHILLLTQNIFVWIEPVALCSNFSKFGSYQFHHTHFQTRLKRIQSNTTAKRRFNRKLLVTNTGFVFKFCLDITVRI